MNILDLGRSLLGIGILVAICYALSSNRKAIQWKLVMLSIAIQVSIAFLLIQVPLVKSFFEYIVRFFSVMIRSSQESAQFLFGDLAKPGSAYGFAFLVLPTIIFFSALSSILYYFGILQRVVYGFAWLMNRTLRLSGAESLAAAINVFIGQTEAPLVIKPYLGRMSRSEMLCLMTGGMATIAGSVFGAYMSMLGAGDDAQMLYFGMHLLTASIISAPAAILAAKMLVPETETVDQNLEVPPSEAGQNFLDALAHGTTDGLKLAVNVGAMLLAFMALVYLANIMLTQLGQVAGLNQWLSEASHGRYQEFNLQFIFGILFSPLAWVIGIDWQDVIAVGQLLGEKTILNEFVAYLSLAEMKNGHLLSDQSVLLATYALCGFSNFASIGIQIGGIGTLAPNQRTRITELGVKALIGGTIACLMTACTANFITHLW
ncbi:MAG: Na+ dependent nucleoside transporter [Saprospiraceae bacterium]|nr:Na+ dependent nucleoside transporter [Saprospiraceae bacterium]